MGVAARNTDKTVQASASGQARSDGQKPRQLRHRLAAPVRADISGDGGEPEAGAGERVTEQEEHDGERYREDQCVAAERFGARGCQL